MDDSNRYLYWNQGNTIPELWEVGARQLACAAEELYKISYVATQKLINTNINPSESNRVIAHSMISSQAFMLAGFALENVLKGLTIQKLNSESPIGHDDARIKNITNTHDLLDLAKGVGVDISGNVSDTLKNLTTYIVWAGRYPRPKKVKDFMPNHPEYEDYVINPTISHDQWQIFVSLFNSLVSQIVIPNRRVNA